MVTPFWVGRHPYMQDEKNLQMVFRMEKVPSDTRMREILDPVDFSSPIHDSFQDVVDPRTGVDPPIKLPDALMSGFAMFALKDPSMLAFDQRREQDEKNLQMVFRMEKVPSDTRMREILDPVDFEQLRPAFRNVFS